MTDATDIQHTLIRASAGTGKTFQLSNRYLALLHQHAEPDTILATTFTRKAAGEILERVLTRLASGATDGRGARQLAGELGQMTLTLDDCRRMLATLCRSLHRVAISTIDSFFNSIVQSFRHELGIPPGVRIVAEDDPLATTLRQEAIRNLLAEDEPHVVFDLLKRLHHDAARRSVTEALDQIVRSLYDTYRQAPTEFLWRQMTVPKGLDDEALADALAELQVFRDAATGAALRKGIDGNLACATVGDWETFLAKGIASKVLAGEATFSRQPIADDLVAVYERLIRHARSALLGREADRMHAIFQLLRSFDLHYTRLRQLHRVLLFSDLPYRLGQQMPSMGDGMLEEICFRLDRRVSHLLLDEFQDTSLEQWQVLEAFASEICSHYDGSRSFFCVGDVKQSIYGWRGGRAELFDGLPARLHLPEDAATSTNDSYRSSQIVLDAVNGVFQHLPRSAALVKHLDIAQAWADGFGDHHAKRELPGYVEVITSAAAAEESYEESEGEPAEGEEAAVVVDPHSQFTADLIVDLVHRHPGRSVGVLASTNDQVNRMIHLLLNRGIAASGEGGNPLTDDPAVMLALSAVVMADHPGHTAASFHVLHSPLAQAIGLQSHDPAHVAQVARSIRGSLLGRGYASVVSEWAKHLAPSCDARGVARLTQLVELADAYAPLATLRPRDFVEYVQATAVEEPSSAAVRVMTVHRAKGLEFDLVVLSQLDRTLLRSSDQAVCIHREDALGPITGVYPSSNASIRALEPAMEIAYQQAAARRLRDDLCALYVAMTRARFALHMVLKPLTKTKSGYSSRGLTNLSYASIVRGALSEIEESASGAERLYCRGNSDWHHKAKAPTHAAATATSKPLRIELDKAPAQARRSWRRVTPSSLESAGRVRASDLLEVDKPMGKRRGTLLHAWFESIKWFDDGPLPTDDELLAVAARVAPTAESDWVAEQLQSFHGAVQQPAVRLALSRPANLQPDVTLDLWRERPFVVRDDQQLLQGVFDRVVVCRREGIALWAQLIDFKSDFIGDQPGSLDERVDIYRPQLRAYRTALSVMLRLERKNVAVHLLFTAAGEAREV